MLGTRSQREGCWEHPSERGILGIPSVEGMLGTCSQREGCWEHTVREEDSENTFGGRDAENMQRGMGGKPHQREERQEHLSEEGMQGTCCQRGILGT